MNNNIDHITNNLRNLKSKQKLTIDTLTSINDNENYNKEIRELTDCCEHIVFKENSVSNNIKFSKAFFCKNYLLCEICAKRRVSILLKKYNEKFDYLKSKNHNLNLSLITMTIQDDKDLTEGFLKLKNFSKKISTRIKDFKRGKNSSEWGKIEGYINSFEISKSKLNKDEWHPHIHMLAVHNENLSYERLHEEWHKISNDEISSNIDIRQIPIEDFSKLLGYIIKPISDYLEEDSDKIFFYKTLKNNRFLTSGGFFRGIDTKGYDKDNSHYDRESVYFFEYNKYFFKSKREVFNV